MNEYNENDPVIFEYVASAIGLIKILTGAFTKEQPTLKTQIVPVVTQSVDLVMEDLKNTCTHFNPVFSALYNAYTEKGRYHGYVDFDLFNAHSLYADSGGLQMITTNKPITPTLKESIYELQSNADFAMCFDEIPIESTSTSNSPNERLNPDNKVFNSSRHIDCGILTGKNIKQQIEYFKAKSAKTKVILIIQGNTPDDMVDYFNAIQDELDADDFDHVGGIAVADTCMGNKQLETVDMLIAARRIANESQYPDATSKHLHLLGVGSVIRMVPVINLVESGFIPSYKRISFDSTKHTGGFVFGKFLENGFQKNFGRYRNQQIEDIVKKIHSFILKPVFEKQGVNTSYDWLANEVFFNKENRTWNDSDIVRRNKHDPEKMAAVAGIFFGFFLYQVHNFMQCLDKVASGEFVGKVPDLTRKALTELRNVSDEDQMNVWKKQHAKYVTSNRITRKEDVFSLDTFF